MPAVARKYLTTSLALMSAGFVTAAQLTPPLQESETRIVTAAVNLVAAVGSGTPCSGYNTENCDIWATPTYTPVALDPSGSAANIPANLVNAVVSVPRAIIDGLNELSYALEVTGNWWVYTPTNVLGFDPADPPKITALIDLLYPFKPLSHVIGESTAWWARANLPMNASCTGTAGPVCSDTGPILNSMFLVPTWDLEAGYKFPTVINPVSDAEGAIGNPIPGSVGREMPWSNAYVKIANTDSLYALANYFRADPATNAPKPITLAEIGATLQRFNKALKLDFNPFVPMSFLLKGWPYTALTPLFKPFLPWLCPTCNPQDPGLPVTPPAAGSATPSAPVVRSAAAVADTEVSGSPADTAVPATAAGVAATTEVGVAGTTKPHSAGAGTSAAANTALDDRTATPEDSSSTPNVPARRAPAAVAGTSEAAAPSEAVGALRRGRAAADRAKADRSGDSGGARASAGSGE